MQDAALCMLRMYCTSSAVLAGEITPRDALSWHRPVRAVLHLDLRMVAVICNTLVAKFILRHAGACPVFIVSVCWQNS